MTETVTKKIPTINAVEGFDPAEFTRQLPNEDGSTSLYLDVKYRLLWFRLHRPQGKIVPEIVHVDEKSAVVSCKLYEDKADAADQFLAQASAQRFCSEEKYGDRYLEIAETAAIGRVLAAAGYGTQFCGNTDMLSGIIADAPIEMMDAEMAITNAIIAPCMKEFYIKPTMYTHIALPNHIHGIIASIVPALTLNAGVRASYVTNHVKQAIGPVMRYPQLKYVGENNILIAPQVPLVRPCTYDYLKLNETPFGQNVIVAFMQFKYNQEDAIILNQTSVESGFLKIDSLMTKM